MEISVIFELFPDLTDLQKEQLSLLPQLYKEWNEKINVISRKDIENVLEKHILHSMSVAKFIRFSDQTKILDLGTGGGFPGVPLSILFPNAKFCLVDSIGKKLKVVDDIIEKLSIKNIKTIHGRAESLNRDYHFVVSRAALSMEMLHTIGKKVIDKKEQFNGLPNGIIALKGGNLSEELKKFKNIITEENISGYIDRPYFETKKIIYLPL